MEFALSKFKLKANCINHLQSWFEMHDYIIVIGAQRVEAMK